VQLVGQRDAENFRRLRQKPLEVALLPPPPLWLGSLERVRAAVHDPGHFVAEAPTDVLQSLKAALVLRSVVQKRCDGLGFAAVFQNQRCNAE
jgi:hypothetical protein